MSRKIKKSVGLLTPVCELDVDESGKSLNASSCWSKK